jgi:hypothetical protein
MGFARMKIIALLFAFVLTGCTGDRLQTETNPTAVALSAPPVTAAFAATVMAATTIYAIGEARAGSVLSPIIVSGRTQR